jgi:hypothetical protein
MQHYSTEYPVSSLGESILPDNDYLPKSEDFVQALKLSDGEMGFYPMNAASGHSSFGEHFGQGMPHLALPLPRGSPMGSMISTHSSGSGANLMLMQKIESLQNQVYASPGEGRDVFGAPRATHQHTRFSPLSHHWQPVRVIPLTKRIFESLDSFALPPCLSVSNSIIIIA